MAEIKLENVSYLYSPDTPFERVALREVNVSFSSGRFTGVIGHTGSGKSTLAQLLNGILKPTCGRVLLDGVDLNEDKKKLSSYRFRVGLVFQYPEYQLFEETVYQDIAFGPKNMGKSPEEIQRLVEEAAHFTGVEEEWMQKSPFELSGGQKRRVAIAGVLAMDPEVIVLDEPAAGLDPSGREEILGRLKTYQLEKKKTVILISHSMEDVSRFADDILILKDGMAFLHAAVDEIFQSPHLLQEAGLDLPQITKLILLLRERGVAISPSIHTVLDASLALIDRLKEGWKC